jgi:hypothetical protein
MLALATCYCNDLYRESARLGIPSAPPEAIATLLRETDAVADRAAFAWQSLLLSVGELTIPASEAR